MNFSNTLLTCLIIIFIINFSISIDVKYLKKSNCPCDAAPIERNDLFLLNKLTNELNLCNIY